MLESRMRSILQHSIKKTCQVTVSYMVNSIIVFDPLCKCKTGLVVLKSKCITFSWYKYSNDFY